MDLESNSNSLPLKPPLENDQDVQDATDLAAMGHAQALTRKFDMWSMLALAFCVLGMSPLYLTEPAEVRHICFAQNHTSGQRHHA